MDHQSQEWHRELREMESRQHSNAIQKRCCRAALNGAVDIREIEDPLLMNRYTLKLNYCPECGEELK
jgi:hypothetical protein